MLSGEFATALALRYNIGNIVDLKQGLILTYDEEDEFEIK